MKYDLSRFFCIKCGNEGIGVFRNLGQQRKSGHLKKLYCLHCKEEVNHYECKDIEDVEIFKEKFEGGEFND